MAQSLSTSDLEAFYSLFREWADRWPNSECLEVNCLGDWEALAQAAYRWASERRPDVGSEIQTRA